VDVVVTVSRTELNTPESGSAVAPALEGGATVWFTGLPSAGKSTLADGLRARLTAAGLPVQLLDGDAMRASLCRDLGYSREDRIENVRRIGHVASTLAADGVVVLCPVIAPYRSARRQVRALHGGRFFEVYVATPLEVCRRRDLKGLYAKQAAGLLHGLTGVDDPYEPPEQPELVLPTDDSVEDSLDRLWHSLCGWRPTTART
jgi:adenylylsulfate kinase